MISIWVRALLYVFIVGGGWLVVLPAGLLLWESGEPYPIYNRSTLVVIGGVAFCAGFCLALWAGFYLIHFGHGTPLPMDPPRVLVTCGPYSYVRNPQAISMVLMIVGEVLITRSAYLWLLLPATLAYLELLVGRWEEQQLEHDFGSDYTAYAERVRKWIPRWTAPRNSEPAQLPLRT